MDRKRRVGSYENQQCLFGKEFEAVSYRVYRRGRRRDIVFSTLVGADGHLDWRLRELEHRGELVARSGAIPQQRL